MHKITDLEALDAVRRAFSIIARPEHFIDHDHCGECAEHDKVLRSRDIETLRIEDVGNPGWDPICFVAPVGFAYYLPALARLCLKEPTYGHGWFGNQFFWHLISDGPDNARYLACSAEQRQAVAAFIEHIIESRPTLLDEQCAADDALRAFRIWSGNETA